MAASVLFRKLSNFFQMNRILGLIVHFGIFLTHFGQTHIKYISILGNLVLHMGYQFLHLDK